MDRRLCAVLLAVSASMIIPVIVETRQMCWSCQYVLKGTGKEECSVAPGNWTGGESRIKCPTMCIITAEFDAITGEPTFIHRGCGVFMQKDGCLENVARHSCFFSCEGKNYCNDKKLGKSPLLADSGQTGTLYKPFSCLMCLILLLLSCILVNGVH